jgi:hypothetical protein
VVLDLFLSDLPPCSAKEKDTFRHFEFTRTKTEEQAAQKKANELLWNSPYRESSNTAQLFLEALKAKSKDLPNLVSPHLGDRLPTTWSIAAATPSAGQSEANTTTTKTAALPLGARIKVDPWNDQLKMVKSRPDGSISEGERMSFQIAPFVFYLTRQNENAMTLPTPGVAANADTITIPK